MFWNKYPYTNFHELNLDWILARMMELHTEWDEFTAVNKITNAGAWDITKQYQAWTVVSDNNIGYISLQPVPAGVAITNTEYWGVIADYDIFITDLSNRISALEEKVSLLENRKFLFLGDSYYLGGGGLVYTGNGWASQIINFWGLDPDHYILATADDVLYEGGISLPAFYPSSGTHQSFKTILEKVAARLSDDDKKSVTDIVVAGGFNDIDKGAAIETGIGEYATYAKGTFPNAKLWCAHIAYSRRTGERSKLLTTRDYYRKCTEYGMNYIGAAEFVLCDDSLITADMVHPEIAGYEKIGTGIGNVLLGGDNAYRPDAFFATTTLVNDTLYSGGLACNIVNYGQKLLIFNRMVIIPATPTHVDWNTPYKVYFTNDMIQPTGTTPINMHCDLHAQGGTDEFMDCVVVFGEDATGKYLSVAPASNTYSKTVESIMITSETVQLPATLI